MKPYDPRVTPARPDLAAKSLEGEVEAARFASGETRVIVEPQAPMRSGPSHDAPLDTEALMGERATIYEENGEGWAWGQLEGDRYVGWLPSSALRPPGPAPTHKVAALRTFLLRGPSIKEPTIDALSIGARITVVRQEERFAVTSSGAFVPARHLAPLDSYETDFVAVAERFLGVPYLWGGKTSLGVDCSGLSQVALNACGVACPRDSDMQEDALGSVIAPNADFSNLRRGDIVFWKGHLGIMRDPDTLVHANAFHMAVAFEPLREAIARISPTDGMPTSVRRV